MDLEQFRRQQEMIVRTLEQRAAPGTHIDLIAVEGDNHAGLPRLFKSRRIVTAPDGTKEYIISGLIIGSRFSSSLISSSSEEKANDTYYALFAVALTLAAQVNSNTAR